MDEGDAHLTFKVGRAEPILVNTGQSFLTLDPTASKKNFSIYAINYKKLNLNVYAVQPEDWPAFRNYLREWRQTDSPPEMPGIKVDDEVLNLDLPEDTLSQVDINLSDYMKGKFGHFVVIVEPPAGLFQDDEWQRYAQTIISWIQITNIGLDAYYDHSEMIAWVTSLKDGAPLSGARRA